MAISSLPSSEDRDEDGIVSEINITPLTDIFLVLLIIFMVTTTVMQDEGKKLDLPTAAESEETPQGVSVSINVEGQIQVNDRVVSDDELEPALKAALDAAEQKIVILRGDRRIFLGQAVNILDLAQSAGAKSIALATQQPEGSE